MRAKPARRMLEATQALPIHRVEIGVRPSLRDPRGEHVAGQIRDFLHLSVDSVRTRDVYHLEADLSDDEVGRVVAELTDPVLNQAAVGHLDGDTFDFAVSVAFKPGVADPVGRSAIVAVQDTLGRQLDGAAVYTSVLYLLSGVGRDQAERIASELLANAVIQTADVASFEEWQATPADLSVPAIGGGPPPEVRAMDLSGSDDELMSLSRGGLLFLSLDEMHAIRDHFRAAGAMERRRELGLGDAPTDVELECLAQTWSEHCKHKIFNATIDYTEGDSTEGDSATETIRSLFGTYIRGTTNEVDRAVVESGESSWLVSVFHDNAGVVTFDDDVHLVYKVETHNSPSALDPYGGAITGIVGVNRDPFGTGRGADLLVNVWGYCFAPPDWEGELPARLLHPHRIRDGVHRGVIDGGNQSGIPYCRGWEVFDHRYLGKPLVFCGTVGSLPVEIDGTPGEEKAARPGDVIVMVGGRIGADGIHGATFSSAALDEASPSQAVQIGDPITQKLMFDFLLEARDRGLYSAITDNGAGGLSSSVGEMAETPGGARLDLQKAPLKYAGLAPWEIFLSEAQERMTVAVPPKDLGDFLDLAERRSVEATPLGEFTAEPTLHVTYGDETVALLDMEFLHSGLPEMRLTARWKPPVFEEPEERTGDVGATLVDLVGRLNIASCESKARHYDHEVKALAVVRPWVGVHNDVPAEATVTLAHHHSTRGFVLSEGVNPYLSDLDTYRMAQTVVDEAVRRQLCVGGRLDRIAALDNFCWPDPILSADTPDGDYKLAQLVRACRGLYDTCRAYGVPLISGKDSMKNEATLGGVKIAVPPTLLLSAIGQIDDVRDAVTPDLKAAGDRLFVVGATGAHCGGSEYYRALGEAQRRVPEGGGPAPYVGTNPPALDTDETRRLYIAVERAMREGLVRSAVTPTKGGLGVALARTALAGDLGIELGLGEVPGAGDLEADVALFSESNGRFVLTVAEADRERFEQLFEGLPCRDVGVVTSEPRLVVRTADATLVDIGLDALRQSFQEGLAGV